MTGSARRRLARVSLAFAMVLGNLPVSARPASAADEPVSYTPFVYRVGTELFLDGEPFDFSGFNLYYANNTREDGCTNLNLHTGTQLADALDEMGPGVNVMRAWFFQNLAQTDLSHEGGVRDWSTFDHTLEVADARGLKVVVTLTDQWGECGDGALNGYKDADWYRGGYRDVDPGNLVSYREWVEEVVTRYRDDPRIAFWQLINEGEVKAHKDAACLPGPNESFNVLKAWATDMATLVKSIDPNHLLSLGTMGGGQCGAQFTEYKELHAIGAIDLCEYHDYSAGASMPGDQWNGLAFRIQQCAELGKPLFVGEVGINPIDVGGTLEGRAIALDNKLRVQRAAGISGHIVWAWSVHGSSEVIYDIGSGDPLLAVLPHAPPADTELVSVASDGTQANRASGQLVRGVDVSGDGRFVAFTSDSTTLVPGSTGEHDTFIRDRATGTTEFAVAAVDGGRPDSWVSGVALSETGRFVVVTSAATNLVASDANGVPDVFVHDRITGNTALVSVASDGSQVGGDGVAGWVDISADGRFVAFSSAGGNLVPGVESGVSHVYLRDRDTDVDGVFDEPGAVATTLVSANAAGEPANAETSGAAISSNGRYVALESEATNLVADDAPACAAAPSLNCIDVFRLDRDADGDGVYDEPGATSMTLESRTTAGEQANGDSYAPSLADNGWVAFWSYATNLGAAEGSARAILRAPSTGQTYGVGTANGSLPTVSANGHYVAFDSPADNEIFGDTNGAVDAFTWFVLGDAMDRVSVGAGGEQLDAGGSHPTMDRTGRFVAFTSHSSAAPGDANGLADVFIRDRSITPPPPGGTRAGPGVTVQPRDPITGTMPVIVTFSAVAAPGITTVLQSATGPDAPAGFTFGDPPTYFDVSTTASYSGPVSLCFNYDEAAVDEATLRLFHFEGGAWADVTTSANAEGNSICGSVTGLSPFALGWAAAPPEMQGIIETANRDSYDHAIILYSEPLDALSVPEPDDFSIRVNEEPAVAPTGVRIAFQGFVGSDIIDEDGFSFLELDLPTPVTTDDSTLITYEPGTRPIRDLDGNAAAGFTDEPITFLEISGPLLAFVDESTGPDHVVYAFGAPLVEPLPARTAFTVRINGVPQHPTSVSISRPGYGVGLLDLKLGSPAKPGDTVTLEYTPGATPLRTTDGFVHEVLPETELPNMLSTTSSRTTPAGVDIQVAPIDSASGTQPISMTFESVTAAGMTTLVTSQEGPALPAGFSLGDPPTYFEIDTTAEFAGSVTICISFAAFEYETPEELLLLHFEEGAWEDVTTSIDLDAEQICGSVTSLSPFAIAESAYEFAGFFSPVDNLPAVNGVNPGRAVPVKFSLGGNFGLGIFADGSPSSRRVDCTTGAAVDQIEQTLIAGTSTLTYDAAADRYAYVWKTDRSWAGQCRELTLTFLDGSTVTARFKFNK